MTPSPSPEPMPHAKCRNCTCQWDWHKRWFKASTGHETNAGYCSCTTFVSRTGAISVKQPVQPEPIAPQDEYDHLRESARESDDDAVQAATWLMALPGLLDEYFTLRSNETMANFDRRRFIRNEFTKMARLADAMRDTLQ